MTNNDKQAAMPFSPQESFLELDGQTLKEITGAGQFFSQANDDPLGNRDTKTSQPDPGKLAQTTAKSHELSDQTIAKINAFDNEKKVTLPKIIARVIK
jgi:hypothetical protein